MANRKEFPDTPEGAVAREAFLWAQAQRTKHHGVQPENRQPKTQRVSVHDYDDPTDEVRAQAAQDAAAARAAWRSQLRRGE